MTPGLGARFSNLERERALFRRRLEGWPPEDLARPPVPGAWSALHVMEHLVIAEEWIVVGLDKAPVSGRPVRVSSVVKLQMIYVIFALRLRVRVPSPRLAPTGTAPLAELDARWEAARGAIRARAARLSEADLRVPRFRHPIAGWLTLAQGLQFTARHIRHHRRQLDRIRLAVGC